jgi:hypothetical protein
MWGSILARMRVRDFDLSYFLVRLGYTHVDAARMRLFASVVEAFVQLT